MKSGSGTEREDRIQEPVHGRQDSNAATPPSDGAPSAVAADGGADASSPSPLPPAPVDRPQERVRQQAGGGSRGTHGSSSAAGVDQKGKVPADIPFLAPSAPRSAGSSPSTPSPDGASALGAGMSSSATDSGKGVKWRHPVVEGATMGPFDSKLVFEQLVREQAAINEAHVRRAEEEEKKEQVKSSRAKKALWSKFKNYFAKIVNREGRQIYSEHVGHQTIALTEVGNYYRVTEDVAIRVNLDAYSRFRPVYGDGECFYRSFIFSYLEQVLDRQDTHEEHRLLDTIKGGVNWIYAIATFTHWRNAITKIQLGEMPLQLLHTSNDAILAFKKLIKKVMGWKRQGRWNSIASTNSYRKNKLLEFFSTYDTTQDILAFLRLVVAIGICSHRDEYEQLITGLNENYSLKDWCFQRVTPARTFTDHIMMTALARALEVPLKVERLFGGGSAEDNIYTGPGVVSVTLLYTGNHYEVIYPRPPEN